jgi:hypothetical protein
MNVFGLDTVVDKDARLVFGTATAQCIDSDLQQVDLATTQAHFARWAVLDGRVCFAHERNCRVGQLKYFKFHDYPYKAVYVVLQINHDESWVMLRKGVFSGLSLGGTVNSLGYEMIGGMRIEVITFIPEELSLARSPRCPRARVDWLYDCGEWIQPPDRFATRRVA